ncbi:Alpha/beta hydrolase fold-1 [Xylariales sp. PMI_506]|nr:Alpha/beta hydrolase fold-1 [Xylariales sp. PMI_506]
MAAENVSQGTTEAPKPVVLLIHGSWHSPSVYDKVRNKLTALGYETHAPTLPSLGDSPRLSWRVDVAAIHDWAIPLFSEGKEVVLVGHSLSGVTAVIATQGQTVAERAAQGLKGGFSSLVLLCAFVAPMAGVDVITLFGGTWPPWSSPAPSYTGGIMRLVPDTAAATFYNDLPEEEAQKWVGALLPNSQATVETAIPVSAADIKLPVTYVLCTKDKSIDPALQEGMSASIPGVKVERVESSHSPMLSQPDRVAEIIVQVAEGAPSK